jgi:hypothetical protein
MSAQRLVRIMVDPEYGPESWWDAARAEANAGRLPTPRLAPLLDVGGPDEIDVLPAMAATIRHWASRLPGWNDGPEYARHPLIFEEVGQ